MAGGWVLPILAAVGLITGCAGERTKKVEERQEGITDWQVDRQNLRQTRSNARQERTDAWFDRAMGNPVKTHETGLKLPD